MTAETTSPTQTDSVDMSQIEARPGVPKPDPVITTDGVVRTFGGLTAVDVEHLEIQRGIITALIGPNGAGKTTFFNLLTGFDKADEGARTFNGRTLDRRHELPHLGGASRELAAVAGLAVAVGLALWILIRATGTSAFALTIWGIAGIASLGLGYVSAHRRGQQDSLMWFGAFTAVGVGVMAGLAALVTPTDNYYTAALAFGWLVGAGLSLGFWRWATGPLPAHEAAQIGMVRTFQLTKALSKLSVIDNMRLGAPGQRGESFLNGLFQSWRGQEEEITERADALLDRFLLTRVRDDFAGTLSGGQRKLLEMARALMTDPEIVMLDEPMAGVNPALTQSLLGHITGLKEEGMTVVFVEHDMDVVQEISDWVVVMAEGQIIAEGPPEVVGADQNVIDAYLGAHHDQSLDALAEADIESEAEAEIDEDLERLAEIEEELRSTEGSDDD